MKKSGPNMSKWREYRITEGITIDYGTNEKVETTRDLYYKLQELNIINKSIPIEIVDIEKQGEYEHSASHIVDVKLEDGKFIIKVM